MADTDSARKVLQIKTAASASVKKILSVAIMTAWPWTIASNCRTDCSFGRPVAPKALNARLESYWFSKSTRALRAEFDQAVIEIDVPNAPAMVRAKLSSPAPPARSLGAKLDRAKPNNGVKKRDTKKPITI